MDAAAATLPSPAPADGPAADRPAARPAWRLAWLTPGVCRVLFALVLAFGFLSHLRYLHVDCPIDLSGDEAQYWDWSRNLDLSYYSKGPLVAYIIRASTELFGNTMPAVRYPALVLGVMTSVVTYLLALKLFRSDRVALGTVLLYHVVPMFVAGSVLMTIDPPFFFCWALATYLLTFAVFDGKRWAWLAVGGVAGVGFLAKYAMFLWFLPAAIVLLADRPSRRWLRTPWPYASLAVAALFTTQVIVWNARNGWVSAKHVGTQTGTSEGQFALGNVLELVLGQIGIVGPGMFVIMVGAVVYAFTRRDRGDGSDDASRRGSPAAPPRAAALEYAPANGAPNHPRTDPFARQMRFLAIFGVTFFGLTFLTAFRAKVQMNWPAPAYFTLMILAAYFLSTRLADRATWKPWRPWVVFTIVFGLLMLPIAHDPGLLYPAVRWANANLVPLKAEWAEKGGWRKAVAGVLPAGEISGQQVDFTYKLKGWEEAGDALSAELRTLGPGAFALCHDYQQAGALAFYLDGQPKTYYAASFYATEPGRRTQYDIWVGNDLSPTGPLVGRNAVFLGRHDKPFADLLNAFDRVEGVTIQKPRLIDGQWVTRPEQRAVMLDVVREGTKVRTFRYFRCYGFKGMTRHETGKVSH